MQALLPIGTYVRVYGEGGHWYGQIEQVDEESKLYRVRMGGTETSVSVPFHKAGLHSAFVASGRLPGGFRTRPLVIGGGEWSYHVTAAANLPNILEAGGLVPRSHLGRAAAYGGLDVGRGATELGGVPERLEGIIRDLETVPVSYQAPFTRKLHDTMLGSKEEFVYATRRPERVFNYADEIRRHTGGGKIIVIRFRAGRRAWYVDEEDDTAEKSVSSVRVDELQAAKFLREDPDVERSVARSYLEGLSWCRLSNELERRFLLLWAT